MSWLTAWGRRNLKLPIHLNSGKDVARLALKRIASGLRAHAKDIAHWADAAVTLPEPFESMDGPALQKAVMALAQILDDIADNVQ